MEESAVTLTDLDVIEQAFSLKEEDVRSLSPLTLAYIGDCIYELVIRTVVVMTEQKAVRDLHKRTIQFVRAETQAEMVQGLLDNGLLSEEEQSFYRRGRNTKSNTSAKNASIVAYRKATGFEALLGYLYLTNQMERILELVKAGLACTDQKLI